MKDQIKEYKKSRYLTSTGTKISWNDRKNVKNKYKNSQKSVKSRSIAKDELMILC